MKPVPWRVQLGVVAVCYAVVCLVVGVLVYVRYMERVNHPVNLMSPGVTFVNPLVEWMWTILIGGLFLIPTFVLVLVIRKSETAYTRYSQILLILSLTAPICPVIFFTSISQESTSLLAFCIYRLRVTPVVIVGLAFSRWFARFDRAKRPILYALLCEVGMFVLFVAFLLRVSSVPPW